MASFRKRGKTWEYRISYIDSNGKQKHITKGGFVTKGEAKVASLEIENQLVKGVNIFKSSTLFSVYMEEWAKAYKYGKLSAKTESTIKRVVKTADILFNGLTIKDITKLSYQKIINSFGQNKAKATVKKYHNYYKACFQHAVEEGIILINPAKNAVIVGDVTKTKKEDDKYISYAEAKKLIAAVKNNLKPEYLSSYMILIGLFTGARFAELLGLTWEDIDFKNHTISINKSWDYHFTHDFIPTKTKENRIITIDTYTEQLLQDMKTNASHNHKRIFVDVTNTSISNNAVNKALEHACKRAGIQNITFHALRHTHGSILLYHGASILYISKRLGHSSTHTTEQVYLHLIDELKETEDIRMREAISNINKI
ncbi:MULTISPECIES: site-specific integrase [unclassified Granulicatella]|uniref:site-specific integrase n=1 Tax=unclassified Granulicatella TaxID=2630493 RepID=UPI001430A9AC|nr:MULTISPECIES: site-specific integrase [unclassified Granulicatella]MBF0781157.1 site-specific integrase [Granulicatella sp. 19428wC4_WM01]